MKFGEMLETHIVKIRELKKSIQMYEEKQALFKQFNSLTISTNAAADRWSDVFSNPHRFVKDCKTYKRITPYNVL